MRWQTIIIMLILMVSIAQGIEMCGNTVKPGVICKMVTPSITCPTYYYSILDIDGKIIQNASLGSFNLSTNTYYFNFSEPHGEYLLYLCDGTTREVKVNGDDDMTDVAIILALIGIAFWLVYTASTFNTKTDQGEAIMLNTLLKSIFYASAGFIAYISIQLSYSFASANSYNSGILDQLMTTQNLMMWFGIIILFLVFFGVFGNAAVNIAKNIGVWVGGRRKR